MVHFSYNNVYTIKEKRTSGGGSLDLPNHVSEALGLPRATLLGTCDYSHNLQIIWNNVLLQHKVVEDLIQLVFKVMDDYRCRKARAYFRARAVEMGI